ncbi:MAG: GNAT family N-acetyltransferase [Chloroflexi bacterium]|nr:GNAT family N-acetyltransferase [Chloroflexota bacterium]
MTDQSQSSEVHHKSAICRFELALDGKIAVLEYLLKGDTMLIIHTEVPPELEGRGIGSQLARAGLDYAREKMFKVVPVCWFVAGYIDRHAEYQDLL